MYILTPIVKIIFNGNFIWQNVFYKKFYIDSITDKFKKFVQGTY